VLFGGGGEDTISGGGGDASINGGDGNDLIFGGTGSLGSLQPGLLFGGAGDDTITSGVGEDTIDGGSGNDLIFGGGLGTINQIFGGIGDDTITSGVGEDTIDGGSGNDLIFGGGLGSISQIFGGDGSDTITSGQGDDTIDGGSGNDLIFGGSGDDTITSGSGDESINGGDGNDLIFGGDFGSDTLDGGGGDDSIYGGSGNDLIFGGAGDDTITAGIGEESINGGDGNDLIFGGDFGSDTLDGGGGDDSIYGGSGNDLIFGGAGDDSIGTSNGDDTLDGGSGNDLIFANVSGNATLSDAEITVGGRTLGLTGFESGALFGGDGPDLLDASAATMPVLLSGGGGDDKLLGGAGNDTLIGGAGNDSLVGGSGDDLYSFGDGDGGEKTVIENASGGTDTLDFHTLSSGITVDLGQSAMQTVSAGLNLTLSGDLELENAFGTDLADTIVGNSLANKLLGFGGSDHLSGLDGDDILQAGSGRRVFLDFESAFEEGEHFYTQEERDAIHARMEQDYALFDMELTQVKPTEGPFVTVLFNAAVYLPGSRIVLGGISDRVGWRELAGGGTVQVDVNGFLGTGKNQLPPTEENFIALSSTIASHELGHTYGLRHHDAFGSPGSGIYSGVNPKRFRPTYTGPSDAHETRLHLSASPASIGTTMTDALGNPFFGEREALKLAFAETGHVVVESVAAKTGSLMIDGSSVSVQTLGVLASIAVPNTIEQGVNLGATLLAAAETVLGSIELTDEGTSESDYYSFAGAAGDTVTIELMSQTLRHRIGNPIDSLLRVYNSAGELVNYYDNPLKAFNDDTFEPTDSILIDLVLPADDTYTVEVDTFSFDAPEFSTYVPGFDAVAFCSFFPAHIACTDSDTGSYELLIYRFDNAATSGDAAGGATCALPRARRTDRRPACDRRCGGAAAAPPAAP